MKEVNVFGVYLPPLFADIAIALAVFAVVKWALDRIRAERFAWHRPLFDVAVFVCILAATTFVLRGTEFA